MAIKVQAPTSTYNAIFDFIFLNITSFFSSKSTIFKDTSITNLAFNFVLTLGAIEDDSLFCKLTFYMSTVSFSPRL